MDPLATTTGTFPERQIVEAWMGKIELALKKKDSEFGQYARECAKFYDGPADFMWSKEQREKSGWMEANASMPTFKIQLNKPHEAVALFGPSLFHQYPNVLVNPVTRPEVLPEALGVDMTDPFAFEQYQMMQAQKQAELNVRRTHANIASHYLNAIQRVTDKKTHARRGITDGMVRGMGLLFTKLYTPKGTDIRYPRSEYINECDFVKDSDATRYEDVQWIAVRCTAPRNLLAEEYGLDEKVLKGHFQSHEAQASKKGKKEAKNNGGADNTSFDLMEYWEIFSKNGFGDKLNTFTNGQKPIGDYSMFGPFCYLVVAKGIPFPLNLPPLAQQTESPEQLMERVSWPIPFWTPPLCDWPVSELGFYFTGGSIYPVPMFKPLIGPIKFVNWCLSFLGDKAAAAGTDYIVCMKKAADSIKQQVEEGMPGGYKWLSLPDALGDDIKKLIQILQAPDFHDGLWKMVADMMQVIDRESGVNELLAGMSSTQMRSAEEASIKQANTQIRPDDMAQRVEDWLTLAAKKEMLAAQWLLDAEDVAAVVGDEAAAVWEQQMLTQDPDKIVTDFDYSIEAGSARKPNIANRMRALNEFGQANSQMLQQMAMGGMVEPWNAYVKQWGDAAQVDTTGFMFPPPDPNQPPPPSEAEQEAEVEMMRLGMEHESHVQELEHSEQKHQQELKQDKAKGAQDAKLAQQKTQIQVQAAKSKAAAKPAARGSKT